MDTHSDRKSSSKKSRLQFQTQEMYFKYGHIKKNKNKNIGYRTSEANARGQN